ncbi:hypothetical protein DFH94DRAFT_364092 [Russula ochroleuca]|jgi:hypothetical protein|uniref:Uncharacterized protein n=1 Tax=Russula ochroleuca TaxID=152965 RepID=A0A9P5MZ35_9AGAM|nr:hypothetical protein DFH94DRAFT_364092 [Russula ochroleuca]
MFVFCAVLVPNVSSFYLPPSCSTDDSCYFYAQSPCPCPCRASACPPAAALPVPNARQTRPSIASHVTCVVPTGICAHLWLVRLRLCAPTSYLRPHSLLDPAFTPPPLRRHPRRTLHQPLQPLRTTSTPLFTLHRPSPQTRAPSGRSSFFSFCF